MLRVIEKPSEEHSDLRTTLDELLRRDALRMLHQALETEVDEYVARHPDGWSHDRTTPTTTACSRRRFAPALMPSVSRTWQIGESLRSLGVESS